MNILLIEDNPVNLKLMEYTCAYERHTYLSARTGREAIKYLQQRKFDLVISDENLPEMRGHEIAHWMRQDNNHREVPMILTSVETNHKLFAELTAAGSINMFIPKPFTTKQLTSALNMVKLIKFPLKKEPIFSKSIDLVSQTIAAF
jgi:CheY-like chemotaxis protein